MFGGGSEDENFFKKNKVKWQKLHNSAPWWSLLTVAVIFFMFSGEVWSLLALQWGPCDVRWGQCRVAIWKRVSRVDHQEVQTWICEFLWLPNGYWQKLPVSAFIERELLLPPAGWWESGRPPPELHLVAGSWRPHGKCHREHPAVRPYRPPAGQQDQRPHHRPLQVRPLLKNICRYFILLWLIC